MSEPSSADVAVTFLGSFFKASTLIDGGWRVSFDVDAQQGSEIAKLVNLKRELLQFAIIPVSQNNDRGPF